MIQELKNFNLAGGTALALQIGHRISVDLDLFGNRTFESDEITSLVDKLGTIHLLSQNKNIIIILPIFESYDPKALHGRFLPERIRRNNIGSKGR